MYKLPSVKQLPRDQDQTFLVFLKNISKTKQTASSQNRIWILNIIIVKTLLIFFYREDSNGDINNVLWYSQFVTYYVCMSKSIISWYMRHQNPRNMDSPINGPTRSVHIVIVLVDFDWSHKLKCTLLSGDVCHRVYTVYAHLYQFHTHISCKAIRLYNKKINVNCTLGFNFKSQRPLRSKHHIHLK